MITHKRLMFSILSFALSIVIIPASIAATCQFAWDNPGTFDDGTVVEGLAGTKLYYQAMGSSETEVTVVPAPASTVALYQGPCKKGAYWATAFTGAGHESDKSNIVTIKKPGNPQGLLVIILK